MLTYDTIMAFLKAGLPDGTGGVLSAIAINLWGRATKFFSIDTTQEDYNKLINSNTEFKEIISELTKELEKAGAVSNQQVLNYGEIEKQVNITTNYGSMNF